MFWFKQDAVLWNRFRFTFFKLLGKSAFWKTAVVHFVKGRGGRGRRGSHDVYIIIGGELLIDDA